MVSSGCQTVRATPPRPDDAVDAAAEPDVVGDLGPFELPRVAERQPFLRVFELPAVADDLAKQPVVVADAVPVGRDAQRGHALHEARRQPAETAVAERRVRFGGAQAIEIDAEVPSAALTVSVSPRLPITSPNKRPIRNSSER